MMENKSLPLCLEKLSQEDQKFPPDALPKVSIVIPVYNCSQTIATTLESVLEQNHPCFEIMIVDGGSNDRTLEIVHSYRDERIHIYSTPRNHRYEMINKGIKHATGLYINILFPGDFYIHYRTLKHMMNVALEQEKPDLAYCGSLLREGKTDVKILFRPLTNDLLKRGQQPTSLQSCWFRNDLFQTIGDFNSDLRLRGGFDLLCRMNDSKKYRWASTYRVLIDYDLRWVTRKMVIRHFWETLCIITQYFGLYSALKWLFCYQKDLNRFVKLWIKSLKAALLGR